MLEKYVEMTGLPREEYFDYLDEPDHDVLKSLGILMIVGERDKHHWIEGDKLEDKRDVYMANRYSQFTDRAHLVVVPKMGHAGYAELYNEKIPYVWMWGHKAGYFKSK